MLAHLHQAGEGLHTVLDAGALEVVQPALQLAAKLTPLQGALAPAVQLDMLPNGLQQHKPRAGYPVIPAVLSRWMYISYSNAGQ